jgi:DNA-binding PadR family transcriptional regulator
METTGNDYTDEAYWNGLIKMSLSKLFILCALREEPRHGYAIMKRVDEMSDGCCTPTEGSIYPTLEDFHDQGYVTADKRTVDGRERTIYELTDKGREAFDVGFSAWQNATDCLEQNF